MCARPGHKNILRGERGMALLLVVSVVALLTVVILHFNRSMRLALSESSGFQERVTVESMALSGLNIGFAVLRGDRQENDFDSLLENWARLAGQPLPAGFGQGEVTLDIVDLSGRFPINTLVATARQGQNQGAGAAGMTPDKARAIFTRLLATGPFIIEDDNEALEIVDSIVDWLDSDDDELPYGAESSYYESLENPYQARNGPVLFIEELLLVRGVTPELLYGTQESPGLADFIAVSATNGKININTAPVELLLALDDRISEEEAENLDAFRTDELSFEQLADVSWYQTVSGWPGDIILDTGLLTTQSTNFRIEAQATYLGSSQTVEALLNRPDEDSLEILYFRMN